MTRDMKSRRARPARKKAAGGTLIGMFIGLVMGVVLAAGVVWYMNKSPLPFVDKAGARSGENGRDQPLSLPGKPGDPAPEKRFQFYDILPGKAEAVPDKGRGAAAVDPKKEDKNSEAVKKDDSRKDEAKKEEPRKDEPKESKTPLFLQAGSFSTPEDADNQKAKLAFMGVEAVVQQVMVQDKTYYRVRVGPYHRIEDLNKVRSDLAKAGVESQLAK